MHTAASRRCLNPALQVHLGRRAGSHSGACAGAGWWLSSRAVHAMKDSWPKLRAPPDPHKPQSAAHIIRNMELSKTQDVKVQSSSGGASSSPASSAHLMDHPYMYPSAAATPSASTGVSPKLPPMPAVPNAPKGGGGPGAAAPPGWEMFSGHQTRSPMGSSSAAAREKRKREKAAQQEEGPKLEVYGMRVIGVLLVAIAYLEFSDYSYGPTGWERKRRPTIRTD
mmetsp:Transcript_44924/g.106653  ORF Transcript_44924/g.106653 Transcript_44924/m.106653 type:complete len:224 (+) Transcript_44924:100-771(+)|eukprot:CAMPEP_0178370278 /NCGR_PEP_ID=MMETSP0689_2-20121128/218_1 /TAXON_ID=160604 /ORGANISM="Amphidinium massartii, Strain CS-259" /LENGTH=223 /DNA_ID=CAMNT_0019990091 /DNA_START=31 /DNA_END=702 /DNA_ORIENTATION=-